MLDLKDPKAFTIEGVRTLLGSKDDSVDRQLRITHEGFAVMTDYDGPQDRELFLCRSETWDEGCGNSGKEATQNDQWVKQVHRELKENWPNRKNLVMDI